MAVNNIDSLNLGKLTQIVFSEGVRLQLSKNYKDFDMIKINKKGNAGARELRFAFQTALGMNAVQFANAGTSPFPSANEITISENTATFKELDVTIRIAYNLWKRLEKNPEKYADSLALELQSKQLAVKRAIAQALHQDGTGIRGVVGSGGAVQSGTQLKVFLNPAYNTRGNVSLFDYGDKFNIYANDGTTARACGTASGTASYYKVASKFRSATAPYVIFDVYDSSDTLLSCNGAGAVVATDGLFRKTPHTITRPATSSTITADYGTLTDELVGLPSLINNDGRLVHGNTLSGASASTVVDCDGATIDTIFIHQLMDELMVNVGQGVYNYKQLLAAPEAIRALIEAREVDRRFNSVDDNARGVRKFVYQHFENTLELVSSEFVHPYNMYILPDSKGDQTVLEFFFNDMEMVKPMGGSGWQLEAASGGSFNRAMIAFMEGCMCLINKHPAATGRLTNFVLA